MALELGDIQGNVLPGFYKDVQDFFFVRFSGRREAREWLRRISPYVSYAAEISRANADFLARKQRGNVSPTPQFWVNVALSYQGLQVLGATGLQSFPIEFRASAEDRARRLGDRPTYATWDIGGPQTEPDALVILGANDDAQMQTLYEHFAIDGKTMCGAPILALKRGRTLGGAEHFGFKDGLSQPVPANVTENGWEPDGQFVAPGEFILGLPNESGDSTFSEPEWARHGSYLAFRQFRQLVEEFHADAAKQSDLLSLQGIELSPAEVAGKLIGRDRDSTEVEQSFAKDPLGDRCPLFAHIRKTNPRDVVHLDSNRHRIIRRGIPYGSPTGADERGLLFVAFQASIARQFEFIHREWLAASTFPPTARPIRSGGPNLSRLQTPGADPITGWPNGLRHNVMFHRPDRGSCFDDFIPLSLSNYVEVRGTGYFFTPSRTAIDMMLDSDMSNTSSGRTQKMTHTASRHADVHNSNGTSSASSYSDLGKLIDDNRPYGDAGQLPDLTSQQTFNTGVKPQDNDTEKVDVFGALAHYGANTVRLPVIVTTDQFNNRVVQPAGQDYNESGVFHVMLPNGEEHRITKGLRIPYSYSDVNGQTVYADILILYSGNGQP